MRDPDLWAAFTIGAIVGTGLGSGLTLTILALLEYWRVA